MEGAGADCGLHPLIHTAPSKKLIQNLVARLQEAKFRLKCVIYINRELPWVIDTYNARY